MIALDPGLVARHAAPVPRYTSYPTAPHFSPAVGVVHYVDWLAALPDGAELSLYLHIPYCHELCWYCGCNTKAVRRYDPVARYLVALEQEAENVAALLPPEHSVSHLHWGGGSPNILTALHIRRLMDRLRSLFHIRGGAEFAVEIDPRNLSQPQVNALADVGVSRISLGVQDFDPKVQAAINRRQTFEATLRAVELFRERGVSSVNIDIVYGLPHQTLATAERTLELLLQLRPDRIAAFGYAHLPSRLKHQRLIDPAVLPGSLERFRLAELIGERLVAAGYLRVGLDHFALPQDALASRPVSRNFQGYTTDRSTALIGLGASAIGRLDEAYVQNETQTAAYMQRIAVDGLAIARGFKLGAEDRIRAYVIERLMCELAFSGEDVASRFGAAADRIRAEADALVAGDRDGLLEPTSDGFRVTERGRPFLRSVCAGFDAYLRATTAQHAAGV